MVYRIYAEKKEPHDAEAKKIFGEIKDFLQIDRLKNIRIIERYDVEGINEETFEKAKYVVFADPVADNILSALPSGNNTALFAVEPLPGQYNERAETVAQELQFLTEGTRPAVRTAKIYVLIGDGELDAAKIKNYIINPIESREAPLDEYQTLAQDYKTPPPVETIEGFIDLTIDELIAFLHNYSLAMDFDDILFCQNYFKNTEKRDPTVTEIRMIDTYWSDHCRHTTFLTEITDVEIEDPAVSAAFENYLELRREVYGDKTKKSVTLMDIATIAVKNLKKLGGLENLDESEEVNACSVNIKVNVNGKNEDWLLMFKNETHNHPTEMEPFGGAATCLGGGIRDPLSGRSYVYQAMRITGAADPRQHYGDTLKGKLPQYKITKTAADGYSSYGNQVGVPSGGVYEIYHPNYAAKRMELGAIVGAAPKSNVRRRVPAAGDAIILLGGHTGRDGCGGATGSSKAQDSDSLDKGGAEVQKGDAVLERRILRMFRNPKVTQMIKRCNDFGAGGVSVAIGELAESIFVDLSLVPVKYPGLDGTELAISESQERMAVVVAESDSDEFIYEASLENLEATKVAFVTDDGRLRMIWNGGQILNIDRKFLNSNGAKKQTKVKVTEKDPEKTQNILTLLYRQIKNDDISQAYINLLSDLNVCAQKGLSEQFDSSIGAGTVLSPFGGRHRLSPAQVMAAKIPVLNGSTETSSVMAYGFSPYISEISPFRGAMFAVVESVSKLVAAGVGLDDMYLSFQEYFPGPKNDPERFGLPFEALLGALEAQTNLGLAAVGGKDSMSGSYSYEHELTGETINIDVPPTLVSFAVGTADANKIISNDFKGADSNVYFLKPYYNSDGTVDFGDLKNLFVYVNKLAEERKILSAYSIGYGGVGEAVFKMCAGGGVGFIFDGEIQPGELFSSYYGAFIIESNTPLRYGELLGKTSRSAEIVINDTVLDLNDLTYKWLLPLEDVFTTGLHKIKEDISAYIPKIECCNRPASASASAHRNLFYDDRFNLEDFGKPRVLLPVLPGTNCEYDMAKHFNESGGVSDTFIMKNLTPQLVTESMEVLARKISDTQILAISGGFTGIFLNPRIAAAIKHLLFVKNGLIFGVGAGFGTLLKLGLLPYGDIKDDTAEDSPALTINKIGRHQSYIAYTKVASVNSPWFANTQVGEVHTLPISHSEGRFCASEEALNTLIKNGQIAAQYCDLNGEPTMHPYYNPAASVYAVEGLFSPDGKIFGKMGHNERMGLNIMKNVPGNKSQLIFLSGIKYFK